APGQGGAGLRLAGPVADGKLLAELELLGSLLERGSAAAVDALGELKDSLGKAFGEAATAALEDCVRRYDMDAALAALRALATSLRGAP
ncbi:MAG: hypothetical protein M0Z80_08785, partial [Treponema sp.]|nr:hypothetical protein [Treponema sp.]